MYDKYSNILSVVFGTYGLANMQEVLGIIILILSICNILINLAIKVIDKIKNKNYKGITEDINDAKEELKNLKGGDKDV